MSARPVVSPRQEAGARAGAAFTELRCERTSSSWWVVVVSFRGWFVGSKLGMFGRV